MFQAKFRVLEKSEKVIYAYVEGKSTPVPRVTVRFWPVTAKNQWSNSTDECEENRSFWNSTPSGEAELEMSPEEAAAYEIGSTYFIDFAPSAEGSWVLDRTLLYASGQLEFQLNPASGTGALKMNVHNPKTCLALNEVIQHGFLEALARRAEHPDTWPPRPRWAVQFRFATAAGG